MNLHPKSTQPVSKLNNLFVGCSGTNIERHRFLHQQAERGGGSELPLGKISADKNSSSGQIRIGQDINDQYPIFSDQTIWRRLNSGQIRIRKIEM